MDFLHKTGLPIDPEWPATKIPWAMENIPEIRQLAQSGRLVYSQLDTWFVRQLTREQRLITDYSTASRSGFYNIHNLSWDEELIHLFQADDLIFPKVVDSSGDFGLVDFGDGWLIPWRGGCLDQAAALLGQGCMHPGDTKITYGTCVGFWHNLGPLPVETRQLSTSIAWTINGSPTYAVAGEMNTAAAALEWLREKILVGWSYDDFSKKAQSVAEEEGLVFITALNGLGAPYWAPHVRGTLYGLTTSSGPEHIARACLEAIAFSVRDLSTALEHERGIKISGKIMADGGMTANEYLMQFQADILGKRITVPENNEGTSVGVAILAGISNGFYSGVETFQKSWNIRNVFDPRMPEIVREQKYNRWRELLEHSIAGYARPV